VSNVISMLRIFKFDIHGPYPGEAGGLEFYPTQKALGEIS